MVKKKASDTMEPKPDDKPFMSVHRVSDAELAFPAGAWQPKWLEIPDEYKAPTCKTNPERVIENYNHPGIRAFERICYLEEQDLFRGLVRDGLKFTDGDPANGEDGWKMIAVIVMSRRLKHEHKLALFCWALDSVFERWWFADDVPPDIAEALAEAESDGEKAQEEGGGDGTD